MIDLNRNRKSLPMTKFWPIPIPKIVCSLVLCFGSSLLIIFFTDSEVEKFSLIYVFDENTSKIFQLRIQFALCLWRKHKFKNQNKDFVKRKLYIFAFNFFMRMFSNVYYSSQFSRMTSKWKLNRNKLYYVTYYRDRKVSWRVWSQKHNKWFSKKQYRMVKKLYKELD